MSLKKVLIISPYFPPSNAADMQRVRMSLPYFRDFGWEAEVVIVDQHYSEIVKDPLLLESIPADIKIHTVKPLDKKWTAKFGLGSLGLRSIGAYRKKVNELLSRAKFDLIYFSTTQFPVCILGPYWKKRFRVPYIIDMQDPWHSEYYRDKPRSQRPRKYWFSYRLNKYLEPRVIKQAAGLISVSDAYITELKARYPEINELPSRTITFGAFEPDLKIARKHADQFKPILDPKFVNIVYVGRGGSDMRKAVQILLQTLKEGLATDPGNFKRLKFYFIGTSYAPSGQGLPTIMPVAEELGVHDQVVEITDRISYYHALSTLQSAQALFIPGSDDPGYTASKLYPYLLIKKPLIAIFYRNSSVVNILSSCARQVTLVTFDEHSGFPSDTLYQKLSELSTGQFKPVELLEAFSGYSAKELTGRQVEFFNTIVNGK